ncbi:MAG: T9SS type A sorting domain-containing protein [Flavobacteriales bacterium]|jgi:hypothetical protein
MKKYLLSIATLVISNLFFAQGLEGIIVEKYYVSDEADAADAEENFAVSPLNVGSVTYRVYADLAEGYSFIQSFGSPSHPWIIETTTVFYNDPNYGFSAYEGTSVNNTRKNTTLIDSYLSVGGVANGKVGVLKIEDTDGTIGNQQGILANNNTQVGAPITGPDGVDGLMDGTNITPNTLGLSGAIDVFDQSAGGSFETTNGTIVALGGSVGVTASNHVLIGQFTTDGTFSFKWNLQILAPDGDDEIYVAENPIGTEQTLGSLIYESEPLINVNENKEISNISFYPNPCENELNLMIQGVKNVVLDADLLDISGRLVQTLKVSTGMNQLDTKELVAGSYFIRLNSEKGTKTIKFLKK